MRSVDLDGGIEKRTRVVMAVNNPATMDYRVVKSAEVLQLAGYDCHVVGTLKKGFAAEEVVNGVTYHRVPVRGGLSCLSVGYFPSGVWTLTKAPRRGTSAGEARKEVPGGDDSTPGTLTRLLRRAFDAAGVIVVGSLFLSLFVFGAVVKGALCLCGYLLLFPLLVIATAWVIVKQLLRGGRQLVSSFRTSTDRRRDRLTFPSIPGQLWRRFTDDSFFDVYLAMLRRLRGALYLAMPRRLRGALDPRRIIGLVKGAFPRVAWLSKSKMFLPRVSAVGVKYLHGRYLSSFYEKLVSLDGRVYHSHELWLLEACVLAARTNGASVVYDSHELETHRNPPPKPRAGRAKIRYEEKYIHEAASVIAVSEGCADHIQKTYGLERVDVLRNTPFLTKLRSPERTLRESLGLDGETPLIVYTGLVTINRGLEKVLEALAHLPGFVLATVGPWNEKVREELLAQSKHLGFEDRFLMHKKVPPEELVGFISSADVAVLPIQNACLSYYYCMPNKLFEAAFAGLPAVVSDFPDMGNFATSNGIGRTCDTTCPRSIADVLRETYDARHSFYPEGKVEALRQRYSFENESKVLVDIYERLASRVESAACANRSEAQEVVER